MICFVMVGKCKEIGKYTPRIEQDKEILDFTLERHKNPLESISFRKRVTALLLSALSICQNHKNEEPKRGHHLCQSVGDGESLKVNSCWRRCHTTHIQPPQAWSPLLSVSLSLQSCYQHECTSNSSSSKTTKSRQEPDQTSMASLGRAVLKERLHIALRNHLSCFIRFSPGGPS